LCRRGYSPRFRSPVKYLEYICGSGANSFSAGKNRFKQLRAEATRLSFEQERPVAGQLSIN